MVAQPISANSNLISQTVQNNLNNKSADKNHQQKIMPQNSPKLGNDSFTNNSKKSNGINYGKICNTLFSTALFIGLFFLPEIIGKFKNKKVFNRSAMDKLKEIKPLLKQNETTEMSTKILKNGNIKLSIDTNLDFNKLKEIFITTPKGEIKQRIFIKKTLLNGKYVTTSVRTLEGKNLADNDALKSDVKKYTVKKFKRTLPQNGEYYTTVERKNLSTEKSRIFCTSNNENLMKQTDNGTNKTQTIFLYNRNTLVGTDKQIKNKDNTILENIVTIPTQNIHHQKYNIDDKKPYSDNLLEKITKNL